MVRRALFLPSPPGLSLGASSLPQSQGTPAPGFQLSVVTPAPWASLVPLSSDPCPPLWVLAFTWLPPSSYTSLSLSTLWSLAPPQMGPLGPAAPGHRAVYISELVLAWQSLSQVRAGGCNSISGGSWKVGGGRGPASQRWGRARSPGARSPLEEPSCSPGPRLALHRPLMLQIALAGERDTGSPQCPVQELPGPDTVGEVLEGSVRRT